jgi:hypothetical protein
VVIVLTTRYLLARQTTSTARHDLLHGVLAGFLPWLHVRFTMVTIIAIVWTFADSGRLPRERRLFAVGALLGLGALSLYTYHLTGSLIPVATYGSDLPLSATRLVHGLPALAFDRVWGLFPHAPLYLLALSGIPLVWRHRPATVWLVGLIMAAVIAPAAAHAYWAAFTTPGRLIVAVVPLLMIFVAEALSTWSGRKLFVGAFVALAILSLETAMRYDLFYAKQHGALVTDGFSGWRLNLLFPSLGTDISAVRSIDMALLVLWIAAATALLTLPFWLGKSPDIGGRPVAALIDLRSVAAALLALGCLGEIGGKATGATRIAPYLVPLHEARERALSKFAELGRCALCYFSRTGFQEPTTALGNDLGLVDVQFKPEAPRAGDFVQLRVRPRSRSGEYIVSFVYADFGDGSTASNPHRFADVDFEHRYAKPGAYAVRVLVRTHPGEQLEASHRLVVLAP